MNAFALDRERDGNAIVPMRPLIAAGCKRIDCGVDARNGIRARLQRRGRELNRVSRGVGTDRPAPDFFELALDFSSRPMRGLDYRLARERGAQALERKQWFVRHNK